MPRSETRPWDNTVFQRVFLRESNALLFWRRHHLLGPPSQPYHYNPFAERMREQAAACIVDSADYLGAAKLLAQAACAIGEKDAAAELGRCDGILMFCLANDNDDEQHNRACTHARPVCDACITQSTKWCRRALTSPAQEVAAQRRSLHALSRLLLEASAHFASARAQAHTAATVDFVCASAYRLSQSIKHCYFSGALTALSRFASVESTPAVTCMRIEAGAALRDCVSLHHTSFHRHLPACLHW